MKNTKIITIFVVIFALANLFATDLLAPKKLEDWFTGKHKYLKEENGVITMQPRSITMVSRGIVDITAGKTYKLSGQFRKLASTAAPKKFYFGLVPYDANKKQILSPMVLVMKNTETTLAKEVKKGDRVIMVKDASKWNKGAHKVITFNAKSDLSDLPNRNYSPIISGIKQNGDVWEITLAKPMLQSYPIDSAIRQQSYGSVYMYTATDIKKPLNDQWQEFSGTIKTFAKSGNPSRAWWAGTKKARIVFFAVGSNFAIQLKDIVLQEVK